MSGRIPRNFIDDLLNRVDIVEVIDSRVPLKKKGREYWACCPFHGEKTAILLGQPGKQFYHCFGCQKSGNAVGFLMDYDHMEFVEAIESLAQSLGIDVPYEQGSAPRPPCAGPGRDVPGDGTKFARISIRQQLKQNRSLQSIISRIAASAGRPPKPLPSATRPSGWNNLSGDEKLAHRDRHVG